MAAEQFEVSGGEVEILKKLWGTVGSHRFLNLKACCLFKSFLVNFCIFKFLLIIHSFFYVLQAFSDLRWSK